MSTRSIWYSRSHRWIYIPLGLGVLLSLLLLANSVRDYIFVSRLLATQQVRRQMREDMVTLEQQLRRSWKAGDSRMQLLQEDVKASRGQPLWISIRNSEGRVLEQEGDSGLHVFSNEEEDEGLRNHEAVYRVVERRAGRVVVEAFALHQGAPVNTGQAASSQSMAHSLLVVELAVPLTAGDPALLRTQRWNLFIGTAGALALLSTVILAAFNVRSYIRGRLLEQQLEIAKEVQARLLPVVNQNLSGVRAAAAYRPAEQVSGDFYDLFTAGNKDAIVIGDVSGKGVPAALLMGVIHGAIRSSSWTASRAEHEMETAKLNQLLCQHAEGNRYATMFWCYYEKATHTLHFINAGQAAPFLVTRRQEAVAIVPLNSGGPVIGLLPTAQYEQASTRVEPHDLLILCSDGLLEATRADGEEYGEDRLRKVVAEANRRTPEEIRTAVLNSVTGFLGSAKLHDDLTLVITQIC